MWVPDRIRSEQDPAADCEKGEQQQSHGKARQGPAPTSLGLVLATSSPERRNGAVRAWTAVGGLAAAAGPVVGGLLVAASWRWVFFVNVPIGLVALWVGWRRLPHVPGHRVPPPDALGAALITGGVAGLVLGLVKGGSWGWTDPRTLAALAGGAAALALFVLYTLRHRNPLIDRSLFRLRPFTGATAVALFFSSAFRAMLLSRVLWAQDVWHWSALTTGLAIAPGPLMVPLFSFLVAGRLIARFGPGIVIAAGSTNREIAQTLFVTEKTVETHLAHTYRKLGVQNRRELASRTCRVGTGCNQRHEHRCRRRQATPIDILHGVVDQPIAVGVGQRPQQHRVDDAEDRGIGADAKRQCQNDDGSEARYSAERAHRIADIPAGVIQPCERASLPVKLFRVLYAAKCALRGVPDCFVRTRPSPSAKDPGACPPGPRPP